MPQPEPFPQTPDNGKTLFRPEPVVVGIGASAGGLSALKTFFECVPEASGLSFVVIVHLSAEHESHLADLLRFRARIPVQQVTETIEIIPDRVYVIPPGYNISAIDTHLRLFGLENSPRARAPIDHFFRTLAATYDGHAIGVILTGTGSDGALGVKEVKAKGGLVIVQDPNEAEYDGMPQSAIATGMVDLVLPVAEIPLAIQRIVRTDPKLSVPGDGTEPDGHERSLLHKIFTLIQARTGRDYSSYKRSTSIRRVSRRMQLNCLDSLPVYLERLRERPDEVRALADDLLITVTNFFRDAEVFHTLEKEVIPKLFEGKGEGEGVRVWSVGCATGEEAYSFAMLLLEESARRDSSVPIQIFATDLHEPSLAKAREGYYSTDIEADVSPERLRRFFQKQNEGYRIRKEVRDLIVFSVHNVLADPPFSRLDLVACRNLLIYIESKVQEEVVELFHYALRPNGYLILGPSETARPTDLFRPVDKAQKILQKRNVPAPEPRLPVFPLTRRSLAEARAKGAGLDPISYSGVHYRVLDRYSPPSLLAGPDDKVVHLSDHAGRYLVHPGGVVTQNVTKLVRKELRVELMALLQAARTERREVSSKPIAVKFNGESSSVVLRVWPAVDEDAEGFALVSFEETEPAKSADASSDLPSTEQGVAVAASDRRRDLQADLETTQHRLQSVIDQFETSQEEMKASNEELQSTNEELRSTLEELETSKEELQSMNEELRTVNQENRHKVEELGMLSSDLQNLLAATDIATLFLDREFHILRFTPKLGDLFNVRLVDRGRPLSDITHRLGYPELHADAHSVLERLIPIEREVKDDQGNWYLTRVRPYRSTEERIEGVVVTFVDITNRKETEDALRKSDDRLAQEVHVLARLHRMFLAIVPVQSFAQAATETLQAAVELLHADSGIVQIVHEDVGKLEMISQVGFKQDYCDFFALVDYEDPTPWGQALRTRRRVVIEDVEKDEGFAPHRQIAAKAGYRAVQSSPLLASTGKVLGVLSTHFRAVRGLSEHDEQILDLLTRKASVLLERLQTEDQLKKMASSLEKRVEERTLAIRERERQVHELAAVMAEQMERNRIAQILHDDLQQLLFGVEMKTSAMSAHAKAGSDKDFGPQIEEARTWIKRAIELTRQLSTDLSPKLLEKKSLREVLVWLAGHMDELHGLKVELRAQEEAAVSKEARALLFGIVRELLFNVVKHSGVDRASVEVGLDNNRLLVRVSDEGRGFDPSKLDENKSYGMSHLRQQLLLLNADLEIDSAPGRGATITIRAPLEL